MTAPATRTARSDRLDLEYVGDLEIVVLPDVFNPVLMRTGEFFASVLMSAQIGPLERVLDMGTGSGVCALVAAQRARQVVAVDLNPAAVRCARLNAQLNRCAHKVDVRCGDLFAPVAGERFDLILFNPPFLTGTPQTDYDRAWRSMDAVPRFAAGLRQHLSDSGRALVLLSTFGEATQLIGHFSDYRLISRQFATRLYDNETLTLYLVIAPP
jgi:methylase of polypeptide subunit release factors